MKRFWIAVSMVIGCVATGSAVAQACSTFDGTVTDVGNFSGNSCGKNLGLLSMCSGGDVTNGAGTSIFQLNIGQPNDVYLTVVSSTVGFNPELALTGSPCSSLTACIIDDTNGTQTVGPHDSPVLPTGSYFVFVSDLNAESPGCGNFNLNVSVFIPVRLQEFSVD